MFPELDEDAKPPLLHGTTPRGLDGGAAAAGHGRFGRMFAGLPPCELSDDGLTALLPAMAARASLGPNPVIPAGFTYLGQFIDHDITFDPNSQLDKTSDPFALTNFRTPRLDLDSLYGSGPADQPYLYDWDKSEPDPGVKLLVARRSRADAAKPPQGPEDTLYDLPRNDQDRALIGDPRNDVHLVIAQLHLLFVRFHNNVVEHVRNNQHLRGEELFQEACRIVRWHYQWIVVHDFLPRVVGPTTAARVIKAEGAWPPVERRHFRWEREPYIPVEFSGAAYRFGHSMVRDTYKIRRGATGTPGDDGPDADVPEVEAPEARKPPEAPGASDLLNLELAELAAGLAAQPGFPEKARIVPEVPASSTTRPTSHLTGFRKLVPELEVDWKLFFAIDPLVPPQESMCIDRGVAKRMSSIPSTIAGDHSLPRLNLQRGRALGLPSGQDVARAIGERAPLSAEELFPKGVLAKAPEAVRTALERSTPLWYYILAEAATERGGEQGLHLGPVGGVIVAEVLMGLIEGDPQSYLSQAPAWTPELPGVEENTFTMVDLVNFATKPPTAPPTPAPAEAAPGSPAERAGSGGGFKPDEFETV